MKFAKALFVVLSLAGAVAVSCSSRQSVEAETSGAVAATVDYAVTDSTVTIGILHSLSGAMALSEVPLRNVLMFGVDEINKSGGVLGRQIRVVEKDPMSSSQLFSVKAAELCDQKVPALFGCWTSASRKSVIPAVARSQSLLFYSVQFEGGENSPSVVYMGATPNQQILPALDFLLDGGNLARRRFFLLGSDYVFPHAANKLIKNYLLNKSIPAKDIEEFYLPISAQNFDEAVRRIVAFAEAGGNPCVLSTINGEGNLAFAKAFVSSGLTAEVCPVMSFSMGENELSRMDSPLEGHYAAWNYFSSDTSNVNQSFVQSYTHYAREHGYDEDGGVSVSDPMCWSYTALLAWKQAVESVGSFDPVMVVEALRSMSVISPAGLVRMDAQGHNLSKVVMIGQIQGDGDFRVVWRTHGLIGAHMGNEFVEF